MREIWQYGALVTYAQVLYGSHIISPVFVPRSIKDKIWYSLIKAIPFSMLRARYVKPLSKSVVYSFKEEKTRRLLLRKGEGLKQL